MRYGRAGQLASDYVPEKYIHCKAFEEALVVQALKECINKGGKKEANDKREKTEKDWPLWPSQKTSKKCLE